MILKDYLKKVAESKTSHSYHHHHLHLMVRVVYVARKIVVTLFLITTNKQTDILKERKVTGVQRYVPTSKFNKIKTLFSCRDPLASQLEVHLDLPDLLDYQGFQHRRYNPTHSITHFLIHFVRVCAHATFPL